MGRIAGEMMLRPDDVSAMLRLRGLGWGTKRIASELGCGRNSEAVSRAGRLGGVPDAAAATSARRPGPLRHALRAEARACVRFETPPGKQLQIDFGELGVVIAGERERVYLFVATLGWRWLILQPQSALAQRFFARAAGAKGRMKKIMAVALARKLLAPCGATAGAAEARSCQKGRRVLRCLRAYYSMISPMILAPSLAPVTAGASPREPCAFLRVPFTSSMVRTRFLTRRSRMAIAIAPPTMATPDGPMLLDAFDTRTRTLKSPGGRPAGAQGGHLAR
jgi:hypothetical protein